VALTAEELGRAVLVLATDGSELDRGLADARRKSQNFVQETSATLTKVGKSMMSTGKAMTAAITLPVIAAGTAIFKVGSNFETTLNQVVGLAGVARSEIGGIRDEILDMAQAIGRDPQELAEAFYFVASAGFEAREAMEVLKTSAIAAAAGLGRTQDVAKVLGLVINAYGKENITAARAADILVAAVKDGTAEADEFAGVLGRVVPTAATLGVAFDQVTAALAGMTLTGLSAEEAATSLNQVLVSLLKPTGQAEEALNAMGLSSKGLREELREKGLLSVLRTLEARFAGNDDAAASVFGNVRALRGVLSLLTLDADQLNGVFAGTAAALGDLDRGYSETEGSAREFDRAMATLKVLLIELSHDVIPVLVEVFGVVRDVARDFVAWWKTLDPEMRRNIVTFALVAAAAGPVLVVLGAIVTTIGKVVGVVGGAIGALTGLGTALGATGAAATAAGAALAALAAVSIVAVVAVWAHINSELDKQHDELRAKSRKFAREATEEGIEAARGAYQKGLDDLARLNMLGLGVPELLWGSHAKLQADYAAFELEIKLMNREVLERVKDESQFVAGTVGSSIPKATADGITAGAPAVGVAMEGIKTFVTAALMAVRNEAGEIVRPTLSEMARSLTAGREAWQQAWEDAKNIAKSAMSRTKEIAAIESLLTSKELLKGLKSKNPEIRAYWKTVQTEAEERLWALKNHVPEIAEKTGLSYADALAATRAATAEAGGKLSKAARKELIMNLRSAGLGVAQTWAGGLGSGAALTAVRRAAHTLTDAAGKYLSGRSPPPEGPLSDIDEGAGRVMSAWAGGLLARLGEFRSDLTAGLRPVALAMTAGAPAPVSVGGNNSTSSLTLNGGIHLHGVGSDVSPAAAARFGQSVLDEVARGFREQGARRGLSPAVRP
jgi:TP901 family phage tail tape measure protein